MSGEIPEEIIDIEYIRDIAGAAEVQ